MFLLLFISMQGDLPIRNKRFLIVSQRTAILRVLKDKIKDGFPKCRIDMVTNAEDASWSSMHLNYHLLIVDESNLEKLASSGAFLLQNFPLLIFPSWGRLMGTGQAKLLYSQIFDPKNRYYGHLYRSFLPQKA